MAFAMTLVIIQPAASRIGGRGRRRRRTKAGQLGSHRSRSSVLPRTRTLIRRRGRAGWRDTSPAGGSSPRWKERPAGNICVTWGAFRGCGPVRPSVRLRQGVRNCYILRCCRGVYARVARCIAAPPPPPPPLASPPLPKSSHRFIVASDATYQGRNRELCEKVGKLKKLDN